METYTPNAANNPSTVQLPQDGVDKRMVGSVRPGLEGAWDKLAHILSGDTIFTGLKVFNNRFRLGFSGLPDSNGTVDFDTGGVLRYVARTLSDHRTYSLLDPADTSGSGHILIIARAKLNLADTLSAHSVSISRQAGGVSMVSFPSGQPAWAVFIYSAIGPTAGWFPIAKSDNATYF